VAGGVEARFPSPPLGEGPKFSPSPLDLRYTSGYLHNVIRLSAEWCSLDADDEELAHFAGKLSRQVGALVDKIERRLS
jgi:hypothetical protein